MNINLKLAIGIIVVFGLLLTGFALYEPLWWKWQEWKLQSDNPREVEEAVEAVAEKETEADPYIKKWLKSGNPKKVFGACRILSSLESDLLEAFYPELKSIISRSWSEEVSAVAKIIYNKKCPWQEIFQNKNSADKLNIKRLINMYRFIILYGNTEQEKCNAAICLGELAGDDAVPSLIKVLQSSCSSNIQDSCIVSLGNIGCSSAVHVLIDELNRHPRCAAIALGRIGDSRAVDPLIKKISKECECIPEICRALGYIRDKRAVNTLTELLNNSVKERVRLNAAVALGAMNSNESAGFLEKAALEDSSYPVRGWAANALGKAGDNETVTVLFEVLDKSYNYFNEVSPDFIRGWAVKSIGLMGDKRIAKNLAAFIKKSEGRNDLLKFWSIFALIILEYDNIDEYLSEILKEYSGYSPGSVVSGSEIEKCVVDASCTLGYAWGYGGEYLKNASRSIESLETKQYYFVSAPLYKVQGWDVYWHVQTILACAKIKWGDISGIEQLADSLPIHYVSLMTPFVSKILPLMPENFPGFDFNSNYRGWVIQSEQMLNWYNTNKHRLAWDAENRKYYLKDE